MKPSTIQLKVFWAAMLSSSVSASASASTPFARNADSSAAAAVAASAPSRSASQYAVGLARSPSMPVSVACDVEMPSHRLGHDLLQDADHG